MLNIAYKATLQCIVIYIVNIFVVYLLNYNFIYYGWWFLTTSLNYVSSNYR